MATVQQQADRLSANLEQCGQGTVSELREYSMKAMVLDDYGSADLFRMADVPTPRPGPGEVLIKVAYASVNPADWKMRQGLLKDLRTAAFPLIIGFDAAGTIEAIGEGVTTFEPGDRVNTVSSHLSGGQGSYAEFLPVDAALVQHLPDHIDLQSAAMIPIAATTAYGATVDIGQVSSGDTVFINGGAGGVSLFAIQMAKAAGALVAVTCSPANNDLVRSYGADITIDYRSEDVLAAVAAWAPGGVNLIVDAIGLGSLSASTPSVVREGGKIVSIFTAIRDVEEFDTDLAAQRGVAVIPNMSTYSPQKQSENFAAVMAAVTNGTLRPLPFEEFALTEVGKAHRLSEEGHVRGKIVLKGF